MIIFHFKKRFEFEKKHRIKKWIETSIKSEKKKVGDINYVFCNDDFLLKKNIEYLNHNTLTDVITFSNVEKDIISGDIMISIDRVKENSIKFKTEFTTELLRVMVHGVLHLIGYDDTSDAQKKEMRKKEDFYINYFLNN